MKSLKKYDPFFWIIRLILDGFFRADLGQRERVFIEDNISKHRKVLWITSLTSVLILLGLQSSSKEDLGLLISSLIAPVMVMGSAWFSISFGGIPAKLISVAMSVTFWIFTAFMVSFVAMLTAVCFVLNIVMMPALALIGVGVVCGCIQYDTADGLKSGLDDAQLTHSRYAIANYKNQGVTPEEM